MFVFCVFYDRGIFISENARYEREKELNRYYL